MSPDAAFEQFYTLYAPAVLGWLTLRLERADAEDLFQDVWSIFYRRWQRWEFLSEMKAPDARPVLSFLYRTCHFALQGHRRRATRPAEALDDVEISDGLRGTDGLLQQIELGRCLALARKICPAQELDVLLAKLAGVPARDIARTLQVTEPVVDHHFRNAIARLRKELRPKDRAGRRSNNA